MVNTTKKHQPSRDGVNPSPASATPSAGGGWVTTPRLQAAGKLKHRLLRGGGPCTGGRPSHVCARRAGHCARREPWHWRLWTARGALCRPGRMGRAWQLPAWPAVGWPQTRASPQQRLRRVSRGPWVGWAGSAPPRGSCDVPVSPPVDRPPPLEDAGPPWVPQPMPGARRPPPRQRPRCAGRKSLTGISSGASVNGGGCCAGRRAWQRLNQMQCFL